ncbi:MAG: PAS domain S-box protein [Nitrospirota bacterium]
MDTQYRVLIVEDVLTDAELNERAIRKVLKPCVFQRVETKKDFLRALDEFKPDLIISDYIMPAFDGMTALRLTKEKSPLTPFIIVTGSMNEDIAVDCMKAGAANYVIKQHLKRLGPAVLHGLKEKKIRMEQIKAQEELKKSEERFSNMLNASPNVVLVHREGTILYINEIGLSFIEYSREEIQGKSIVEFLADDSKELTFKNMKRRLAGEIVEQYEIKVITKSHGIKDCLINASLIPYGEDRAILVILTDITDRKKTEEEIKKRIQELEDFYAMAVGRELRMKELKEKMEEMKEYNQKVCK